LFTYPSRLVMSPDLITSPPQATTTVETGRLREGGSKVRELERGEREGGGEERERELDEERGTA